MFRSIVLALLVALSSAFMAPFVPAAQRSMIVMQEQPTGMRTPAPAGTPMKKAPKSGWSLTMAGGQRTVADVYEARDKARKAYEKTTMGEDGKSDLTMKVYKGWTTK